MAKKKKTSPKRVTAPEPVAEVTEEKELAIAPDEAPPSPADAQGRDYFWLGSSGLIILVAAVLRFIALDLKPFHHDEGVNGWFLATLFKDGVYKYDPANYHGPTLYYIALAFAKMFGLETIPVRLSMAIFGLLAVVLVLFLRRYLGTLGTLLAALFLALSPGMVFISRYFIHEILFVFLSLAIVVSVLFFIEKRRAGPFAIGWMALLVAVCFLPSALTLASYLGGDNLGALWAFRLAFLVIEGAMVYYLMQMLIAWDEGRPIYLLLASASVALLFATKETAFITLGTMMIACMCIWIWRGFQASSFYKTNWTGIVIAVHAAALAAALYYRQTLADGYKWLFDSFLGTLRPHELFVFLSIVFLLGASLVTWIFFLAHLRRANETNFDEPVDLVWSRFRSALGASNSMLITIGVTAGVFILVFVMFFSSFLTYGEGVLKAFEAYAIWTETGNKDHTMNGTLAYVKWGMKVESAILILSLLGSLIALAKGRHRFAMFGALWAIGLFAAYTIIPYKTPWLALSFLLPMCIVAGYGLGQLLTAKDLRLRIAAIALSASAVTLLSYQTYQINFVRYDDDDMAYIYAHTRRQFLDLVNRIKQTAEKSGKGTDASIEIVSPDYWPMTWYLKDYPKAVYHGRLADVTTSEVIVAKKKDQDREAITKYSPHYKFAGVYGLRPGVDLVLLVRNDLAEPGDQDMIKILETPGTP